MAVLSPDNGAVSLADRRVLVVEDDETVREVVGSYLGAAGYIVDEAADGFAALEIIERVPPDLVIMDRMLPGIDGAEVCRRIRESADIPVILLTALSGTDERIDGLEAGADDYVTKPFSPRELVLRVQSVLRRSLVEFAPEAPFGRGEFELHPSARVVHKRGVPLLLSAREFELFAFLLKHPQRAFTREELLGAVWGWQFGDLSTVTVTMRRLREKVEDDPQHPRVLTTVWGVGYRLDVEDEPMIPLPDLAGIVGIALAVAAVVGAAGLLALHLARHAPIAVRLSVVVLTATVSVAGGMVAVAQAMFLSPHDLLVGIWVAISATLVSLAAAIVLGRAVTRQSERLRHLAAELGEGVPVAEQGAEHDRSELAAVEAELVRTSRRLQEARDEVAALDASRRELFAWISHDLRTPLAGLRAMAEALEDGLAEDPQRFHRQMRSQVDHLSDLVDDLFELSKIQSGRLALTIETVSLYDIVSDAVAELRSVAAARDIVIRESSSLALTAQGDARELARVVGNLLINAIQHSPPGSEIAVTTGTDDDGNAVLSVVDAGGGIADADLPRVFTAGWRASVSRTPDQLWGRSSGAGLGLAIVEGIVKAHEGQILARNVEGGCRFDVVLPRTLVA